MQRARAERPAAHPSAGPCRGMVGLRMLAAAALACGTVAATACQRYPYDPTKATRAYPRQLKQGSVADIQVLPNLGANTITIANATAQSYTNFDLWINQRYVRHIDSLRAGETLDVDIDSFWDERGEGPFPGGWFRYYQPTPIVLAQIQTSPDAPLIGLLAKPPDTDRR
jgi:hypothetical protein